MTIATSQDLFFLILAIATGGVAVFLCWALYEVAKMLHQANEMVTETRERMNRIERAVTNLKEKIESSFSFLSMFAEGGKALLSYLHAKKDVKEAPRKKKRVIEEDEETQDEE